MLGKREKRRGSHLKSCLMLMLSGIVFWESVNNIQNNSLLYLLLCACRVNCGLRYITATCVIILFLLHCLWTVWPSIWSQNDDSQGNYKLKFCYTVGRWSWFCCTTQGYWRWHRTGWRFYDLWRQSVSWRLHVQDSGHVSYCKLFYYY